MKPTDGAALIAAERRRQIEQKGYSPEHDQEHDDGSLLDAAQSYLMEGDFLRRHPDSFNPETMLTLQDIRGFNASPWPWSAESWKPSPDPVRNLVKAGALIAAEIDRLLPRAADQPTEGLGIAETHDGEPLAYSESQGEWTITGSYAKSNNIRLYRNGVEHTRCTAPGYKIWNYAAHLSDIVAEEEAAEAIKDGAS